MNISACIIARNEEEDLPRCIRSVKLFADETISIDSGSSDHTCEVAQHLGAKVIRHEWEGYVKQKNFAIGQAQYDWIFSIDADEEVSEELIQELLVVKRHPQSIDGFLIPRVVVFQDKKIRFGDWYPDYLIRLFRKNKGKFVGGSVHERLELDGITKKLKNELYHYTYKDHTDQMLRIEQYATLWAKDAFRDGKKCSVLSPWIRSAWRFFRGYILKGGWKGGALGWQISQATAYETYWKYLKLRTLHLGKELSEHGIPEPKKQS
jgi:glycosyltransferase involved in cell wall biosynthesis